MLRKISNKTITHNTPTFDLLNSYVKEVINKRVQLLLNLSRGSG